MAGGATTQPNDWQTVSTPDQASDWQTVDPQHPPAPDQSGPVSRFASGVWDQVNPIAAIAGVAHAVQHPADTVMGIVQAHKDQFDKALDAWHRGEHVEAAGHLLGSAIPIIGPAAAKIGETIGGDDGGTPPDVAKGLGQATGLVGSMLLPGALKSGKVESALSKVPIPGAASGAERLYQSALKPGAAVGDANDVAKVVGTGLQNSIPVSEGGVQKLYGLIDDLNQKIKARVQHAAANGVTIDPQSVAKRVDQIAPKFGLQVNPDADMSAIEASKSEFLNGGGAKPGKPAIPPKPSGVLDNYGNPVMDAGTPAIPPTPRPPIPADVAQEMKQNTYSQIRKSYGQLSSAQVEAQKALARGIKEELANEIPGLSTDNAQEGSLLDLTGPLENRVRVTMNHNMMGIGTPIVADAAAKMGGAKLGIVGGVMKAVLDDPAMKSRMALALYKSSRASGTPLALAKATARINQFVDSLGSSPALQGATAPAQ